MKYIEQFGKLPLHVQFAIGTAVYTKVSETQGMDAKGKLRRFESRTVVDVEAPVDSTGGDAAELIQAYEDAVAARRKAA